MSRRPIAFALALALLPLPAFAQDLLQTYELARQGDPVLSIAESNRAISREGEVQARAQLLPSLNGSASLNRSWTAGRDGNSSSRAYGASLNQTVFNLGQISSLRAQRELNVAAEYDLTTANHDLMIRTAQAYFDVLVAIETLAAAEAAEESLRGQFDYAEARLEAGLAPITDVHEARAQYDASRASVILVRNSLEDAYQALAEITGQQVRSLRALPPDFQPEVPAGGAVENWIAAAIEGNPSLRAAEYSLRAAEHSVTTARSQHLPSVALGANYSHNTGWGQLSDTTDAGLNAGTEGHSVGLNVNIPIFNGGATQSGVRDAVSRRDIAEDALVQTRRALERNTRAAYQAVVAGVSEIEARRQAVLSARSAYEAAQIGLEVGVRTVIEVLISQQTLFNAESDYAVARYSFLLNRLLLSSSTGSLNIQDLQEINRLLTVDAQSVLD